MTKLLDFTKVVKDCTGGNAKIKQSTYLSEGVLPVVDQGQKLIAGYVDDESVKYKGSLPCVIFGDHTCALKYVDYDFALGADGTKILVPDHEYIDAKYLFYFLNTVHIPDRGYSRHFKYLKRCKIPIVPLSKQRELTKILDTADSLRQKRNEQLALLDDYLKSVFLDMFGDPVTNENDWDQLSLGDISSDMKYGTNVKCFERSKRNSIPVLRIPNIYKGDIDLTDLKYGALDKKEFNKLLLKKNDLLFVRTNGNRDYIGRCAVFSLEGEYVNASYLIRVRLKEKVQLKPSFICYVVSLPSYRSMIARESRTTAGNYNINTQGLKNLKIIQPPIVLQDKFADIVEQVEQTKQKMHTSLDEMNNHFNALMQRYFG